MVFDTEGNSGEFVELVATELNYLGPQDLTQYFIRSNNISLTPTGFIEVEVVLGRRLLGTLLTVYIPTILLVIIAHMTNYFKAFFFEAVVSVNLTVSNVGINLLLQFTRSTSPSDCCRLWLPCLFLCHKIFQKPPTSRWLTSGSFSTS